MRRLLILLVCLCWPVETSAAIAVVQTATKQSAVTGDVPITFTNDTVAHNGIIVFIYWDNGVTLNSVDDDVSSCSGYTHLVAANIGSQAQAYYCADINASTTSVVTAHFSGAPGHFASLAYEISGQATSTPIDQTAASTPTSSSAPSGPAVTTTTAHTLVMGFIVCDNGVRSVTGLHSGNTFTSDRIDNTTTRCSAIASKSVTSCASSLQPQWDLDGADTTIAITVAWKESGSSGCGSTFPGAIVNAPVRGGGIGGGWIPVYRRRE